MTLSNCWKYHRSISSKGNFRASARPSCPYWMMNPAINAFQSLANVHLTNSETALIQCRPMVCGFGVHSLWWMNNTLTLTWCYCGDQGRSTLATRYPSEKKFCYWSWLANCQWRVERLQCSNKNNVFFCTSAQHSLVVNPLRKKMHVYVAFAVNEERSWKKAEVFLHLAEYVPDPVAWLLSGEVIFSILWCRTTTILERKRNGIIE